MHSVRLGAKSWIEFIFYILILGTFLFILSYFNVPEFLRFILTVPLFMLTIMRLRPYIAKPRPLPVVLEALVFAFIIWYGVYFILGTFRGAIATLNVSQNIIWNLISIVVNALICFIVFKINRSKKNNKIYHEKPFQTIILWIGAVVFSFYLYIFYYININAINAVAYLVVFALLAVVAFAAVFIIRSLKDCKECNALVQFYAEFDERELYLLESNSAEHSEYCAKSREKLLTFPYYMANKNRNTPMMISLNCLLAAED